ncbi:unnamed protein product [Closterium sp. NIES-53]
MFSTAFASPKHLARTRQAHDDYRRQRQLSDHERKLSDVVERDGDRPPLHLVETKASFLKDQREQGGKSSTTPIQYWGGPVLNGETLNIYVIYYGFWPAGVGQNLIENFIRSLSLGGADAQGQAGDQTVSNWWATSTKYYSESTGSTTTVSSEVNLAKVIYDKGSRGRKFGENTPWEVVKSKIGDGKPLPYDANGIYLLLTSKDVKVPGFCTEYCGYHTMDYIDQDAVAYSLVGHHGKCPQNCGGQRFSPNANPAIDATISTIAHEIAEAATDPDASTGWLDADKEENADKCSYTYGTTKKVRNKKGKNAKYNLVGLNRMKFLVQQNWDFGTDSCVSQAPE